MTNCFIVWSCVSVTKITSVELPAPILFTETSSQGKNWMFQQLHWTKFYYLKRTFLLKNGNLKISDSGLAKNLEAKSTNSFIGTPAYMSPEIWEKKEYYFKSDVWCELTRF